MVTLCRGGLKEIKFPFVDCVQFSVDMPSTIPYNDHHDSDTKYQDSYAIFELIGKICNVERGIGLSNFKDGMVLFKLLLKLDGDYFKGATLSCNTQPLRSVQLKFIFLNLLKFGNDVLDQNWNDLPVPDFGPTLNKKVGIHHEVDVAICQLAFLIIWAGRFTKFKIEIDCMMTTIPLDYQKILISEFEKYDRLIIRKDDQMVIRENQMIVGGNRVVIREDQVFFRGNQTVTGENQMVVNEGHMIARQDQPQYVVSLPLSPIPDTIGLPDYESEYKALMVLYEVISKEAEELRDNQIGLARKYDLLKKKNEETTFVMESTRNENLNLKAELERKNDQMEIITQTNKSLQGEIEEIRRSLGDVEMIDIVHAIKNLNKELTDARENFDEKVKLGCETLEEDLQNEKELLDKVTELTTLLFSRDIEIRSIRDENQQLNKTVAALLKEIDELRHEFNLLLKSHSSLIEQSQLDIEKMKNAIKIRDSKRENLSLKLRKCKEELETSNGRILSLSAHRGKLRKKLRKLWPKLHHYKKELSQSKGIGESYSQKVELLEKELDDAREEVERKNLENYQLKKDIADAEEQSSTLQSKINDLQAIEGSYSKVVSCKEELEQINLRQLNEISQLLFSLEETRRNNDHLEEQLKSTERESMALRALFEDAKSIITDLKESQFQMACESNIQRNILMKKMAVFDCKDILEKYNSMIEVLEKGNTEELCQLDESLQQRIQRSETERETLKKELCQIQEENAQIREKLANLTSEMEKLNMALGDAIVEKENVESTLSDFLTQSGICDKELEQIKNELEREQAFKTELQRKVDELAEECKIYKIKLDTFQTQQDVDIETEDTKIPPKQDISLETEGNSLIDKKEHELEVNKLRADFKKALQSVRNEQSNILQVWHNLGNKMYKDSFWTS